MTQHDPLVSVRQMLDYAEEALQIAAGRARAELDTDRLFNLAIVRLLEITVKPHGVCRKPSE